MGLFDFIKEMGLGKDKTPGSVPVDNAKAHQELTDELKKAGLSLQDFQLRYDQGLATLSGTATTQKDLELARLIVGNHRLVRRVNDDALAVAAYPEGQGVPATPLVLAAQRAATTPARMVTVKIGDTLSAIAQRYLGSASRYQEIFEANRPMLKNPDAIFPGQVLRIPAELTAH